MAEQRPREVPWIERIARWVPGYGGYMERGSRRSADQALRDVVAGQLLKLKPKLEEAIRSSLDQGALGAIAGLERASRRIDRIADRLRAAGGGTDAFYSTGFLDWARADTLHSYDMDLLTRVDEMLARFESHANGSDLAASLEADLAMLEGRLDERAKAIQGIS